MLDMQRTREVSEASTDFTLAVEEEFQLLDPETLDLTQRYSELRTLTDADPVLAESVAGELIESEIEIRSGHAESWTEMVASQREARWGVAGRVSDRGGAAPGIARSVSPIRVISAWNPAASDTTAGRSSSRSRPILVPAPTRR